MSSNKSILDPEVLALEIALNLSELLEPGKGAKAIVRRAKDLPSLIASTGLVQALTFYMAKAEVYKNSNAKHFADLVRYLMGDKDKAILNNLRKHVTSDAEGEGRGYLTMLAVAAATLSKIVEDESRDSGKQNECKDLTKPEGLAKCLRNLKENNSIVRVEARTLEVLTTVKRLIEAFYAT